MFLNLYDAFGKEMRDLYGVRFVSASHCTGETAHQFFKELFGEKYSAFGLGDTQF